jgi:16S rRNA processing protein RimM
MSCADRSVVVGKIVGLYGVKGWVRVHSFTEPPEAILAHAVWALGADAKTSRPWALREGKAHGRGVIACFEGLADRDVAAALVGSLAHVAREALPALEQGQYYWADLEGLRVLTQEGVELGLITHLFETGANDVMVVVGERERLIPYVMGSVVKRVDLVQRELRVDWDPEF